MAKTGTKKKKISTSVHLYFTYYMDNFTFNFGLNIGLLNLILQKKKNSSLTNFSFESMSFQ